MSKLRLDILMYAQYALMRENYSSIGRPVTEVGEALRSGNGQVSHGCH
jgi:hypothetical protein